MNRAVFVLLLFMVVGGGSGLAGSSPWLGGTGNPAPEPLIFVREFSSAQDVRGVSHPILNKSLDIVAGPKDQSPPAPSMLQEPYAVTTDSSHRILVTDVGAGTVHVFDFAHAQYSVLRGGDRLVSPLGIAADHENNVYVSDSSLRTVLIYDSRGKFVRYLKQTRGSESYFDAPRGIAVEAATGHIYVCDTPRHMVIVVDKKGRVLGLLGKRGGGTGPGEFRYPTQVFAGGGELLVLDSGNSRVQIFDLRGHFQKEFPLADVGKRAGLAVDQDRNIYVTDPELNQLQVFSQDGRLRYFFGQSGTGTGQFNGLSGAWVDAGYCLYLVDSQNKRVQLFRTGGAHAGACD